MKTNLEKAELIAAQESLGHSTPLVVIETSPDQFLILSMAVEGKIHSTWVNGLRQLSPLPNLKPITTVLMRIENVCSN